MFSSANPEQGPKQSPRWLEMALSERVLLLSDPNKRRAPHTVADEAERTVARLLSADAAYAKKVARVRRYQARLRGQLSQRDWRLYLELEEAQVGRWTHALERVAHWALTFRGRSRR